MVGGRRVPVRSYWRGRGQKPRLINPPPLGPVRVSDDFSFPISLWELWHDVDYWRKKYQVTDEEWIHIRSAPASEEPIYHPILETHYIIANDDLQGYMMLHTEDDDHVWIETIEIAPWNRTRMGTYKEVARQLVEHATQESHRRGLNGRVAFVSFTSLISHWESFGMRTFQWRSPGYKGPLYTFANFDYKPDEWQLEFREVTGEI